MTIKKRKGRSKINLYREPKFRVSVLYSSRKQEKAKIFRRGRTEESQKCWRPKVHIWLSLRTRGQRLGSRRWTFVPALLWCEVYARWHLNHSAAVGWWLLKHRQVKTNKQGNKQGFLGHPNGDISSSTRGKVWRRKTARIFSSQRSTAWIHLKTSKKSRRTLTRHHLRMRHPVCKGTTEAGYCQHTWK